MGNLVERFVLRKEGLNLDKVVKDAIEVCEGTDREIIIVGSYIQYFLYQKIKHRIKKSNSLISVSYKKTRPETNLPYNKGPYLIEIDCFKFEQI